MDLLIVPVFEKLTSGKRHGTLDIAAGLDENVLPEDFLRHILAQGELIGTFER